MRPALLLAWLLCLAVPVSGQTSFVTFESGPVRPLALSTASGRLFAVNTPDGRLEIFDVKAKGLVHIDSVPVGMEPVAVAIHDTGEVWVVNHLSDSISIVDVSAIPARVVRTLLVGDEPRDLVFTANDRAFVTTAHRGQHREDASLAGVAGAGDPELLTPGVGRADVWVFDAGSPGAGFGGTPLRIVSLFGDTPRALATDGTTVYVGVFHSGNQTTTVNEGLVCDGFGTTACPGDGTTSPNGLASGMMPGGNPGPSVNHQGITAPEVGLIVKFDATSGEWRDEQSRNWSNAVRFSLPDRDVFALDSTTLDEVAGPFHGVGTTIFNMTVNPVSGVLYVSNTEAQNLTRFEGPGGGGSTVQGNLAQSRITVLSGDEAKPRHLNRHIDYGARPAPPGTSEHSLAIPLDMVVSSDGSVLYVAAFGSSRIGVFATADLESDALWDDQGAEFDPTQASAAYLDVPGGGPAGLALDEGPGRLYVLTRFDNAVVSLDTETGAVVGRVPLHNPEPAVVVEGRPMLYDAGRTSSNGEASCASCHVFGDMDQLAWDLGDPDADVGTNPAPINLGFSAGPAVNGDAAVDQLHPMKGPMATQTLRGLSNSGAMHWRGDRADGFFGLDEPYVDGDEVLSFNNFIVAFEGLLGDDTPAENAQRQADMQTFTEFALEIALPPNPIRALDNVLDASEAAGLGFFDGSTTGGRCSDGLCPLFGFTCEGCHTLDASQGLFGTSGIASFENEPQIVKIPHLRNQYQKIGMFGMPTVPAINAGNNAHLGDQIRGFGFLHDGSVDTVFRFLEATVFNANGQGTGFNGGDAQRRDVERFMFAFDADLAPIVGQQITLDASHAAVVGPRIDLLIQRAAAPFTSKILGGTVTECDLVVHGLHGDEPRGFRYDPGAALFRSDRAGEPGITDAALRALADDGRPLTYTCVPPGSGVRAGQDRDQDGFFDGDERDARTDPADASEFPGSCSDGLDSDGDGVDDDCDNCTAVANPGQQDASAPFDDDSSIPGTQHYGDACDADLDDDGSVTMSDFFGVFRPCLGSDLTTTPGCVVADLDDDGVVGASDFFGLLRPALGGTAGPGVTD